MTRTLASPAARLRYFGALLRSINRKQTRLDEAVNEVPFRCGICHVEIVRRAVRAICETRGVDASTSTQV